jgi:hypothetical protein
MVMAFFPFGYDHPHIAACKYCGKEKYTIGGHGVVMPAGAAGIAAMGFEAGDLHIYRDCKEEEGDGTYDEF